MKRHVGSGILILVILLAVGFATVATNLIINGQANINANTDDFDIYFTEASTDEGGTATIDPSNNKSITFVSKKLSFVGNSTELNYTVYNNSSQYDANVNVEFNAVNTVDGVDYSDYYTISFEGFDPTTSDHTTLMPGKTTKSGKITITLVQALLKEVEIKFTLTLVPSAVEIDDNLNDPEVLAKSQFVNDLANYVNLTSNNFSTALGNGTLTNGLYVYNIENDLGLTSTGDNKGYVVVNAYNADNVKYFVFLHDNTYMITNYDVTTYNMPDRNNSNIQIYSSSTWSSTAANEYYACISVDPAVQSGTAQCYHPDGTLVTN